VIHLQVDLQKAEKRVEKDDRAKMPPKLLSSSYKQSYFINQCPDDDYKQKKIQ